MAIEYCFFFGYSKEYWIFHANCTFIKMFIWWFFSNIKNKIHKKILEIGLNMDFIYGKCLFYLLFIFFFIFFAIFFWTSVYLIKQNKNAKNYLFLTINVIYETLYSNLVSLIARSVSCVKLGNDFFNSQNLSLSCSDEAYYEWVWIEFFFSNFKQNL